MAVIDLRGSGAEMGASLARLGQAGGMALGITQKDEEKKQIREILLSNPAGLARQMREPGFDPSSLSEYDITPADMDAITKAHPETFEESYDRALRGQGLAQRMAELQGVQTEAGMAEAAAAIPEAQRRERAARYATTHGVDESSMDRLLVENSFAQADTAWKADALESYLTWLDTEASPQERMDGMMSIANPQQLQTFFQRENLRLSEGHLDVARAGLTLEQARLNLQRATAAAAAQPSPVEMFNLKRSFIDEFNTISARLADKEKGFAEGEIDMLINRFNQLSNDYISLFPGDPVAVLDAKEAFMGTEATDAFYRNVQQDNLVAIGVMAGELTLDDVERDTTLTRQEKDAIKSKVLELQTQTQKGTAERFIERLMTGQMFSIGDTSGAAFTGQLGRPIR